MTETAEVIETPSPAPAKPKAKRKYVRRAKRAVEEPKPSLYEGMSARHPCAFACKPERCVVTHNHQCGSPYCGGPRAEQMYDNAITKRFAEAKAFVAHARIENRMK